MMIKKFQTWTIVAGDRNRCPIGWTKWSDRYGFGVNWTGIAWNE